MQILYVRRVGNGRIIKSFEYLNLNTLNLERGF